MIFLRVKKSNMDLNHFDRLPPKIFTYLLTNHFYLHELISLRLVCSKWKSEIESNIFEKLSSLKLFSYRSGTREYVSQLIHLNIQDRAYLRLLSGNSISGTKLLNDDLIVKNGSIGFLFHIFPNIKNLVIHFSGDSNFAELPDHLPALTELKSLTLTGQINTQHSTPYLKALINSINQSIKLYSFQLKRLDLLLDNCFDLCPHHCFPSSELLSGLTHLSVYQKYFDLKSLKGLSSQSIRSVSFDHWHGVGLDEFENVFQLELASKVTHLRLSRLEHPEFVWLICTNFTSLRCLDLTFPRNRTDQKLSDYTSHLTKLTHLTDLYLEGIPIGTTEHNCDTIPTVKTLQITNNNSYSSFPCDEQFFFSISRIFPSVEQLTVRCYHPEEIDDTIRELCEGELFGCLKKFQVFHVHPSNLEVVGYLGRHGKLLK